MRTHVVTQRFCCSFISKCVLYFAELSGVPTTSNPQGFPGMGLKILRVLCNFLCIEELCSQTD